MAPRLERTNITPFLPFDSENSGSADGDASSRKKESVKMRPPPYLPPCPESSEDTDPLCLYKACQGVLTEIYCDIKIFAAHYAVPEDALIVTVTDWVVSRQMGVEPLPADFFVPERDSASHDHQLAVSTHSEKRFGRP